MIRVEELYYGVPAKDLYSDVSFTIESGQHCVLIGSNGTGKSTLADMLKNPEDYLFDGSIKKAEDCRIGFANQFSVRDKAQDCTVFEYLSERFLAVQNDIEVVCQDMATAEDMEPLLEKYQELLDLNEAMDGDNYESNIYRELNTAGMTELKDAKLSQISGGEYKVLQIVREMLLQPNLLIMDEPDVFLDFENINSLCRLINGYKGALLVITHNRYMLNHCFDKILHLENGELYEFEGTYFEYRCWQLREKLELQRKSNAEQEEIQRTEELVDILRTKATLMVNPTLGRSVNAKQSQLDRLKARQIEAPFIEMREPVISLPEVEPEEEKVVLKVSDYNIEFDSCLLEDVNFQVMAGEKVAIVGPNGTGKTTLIRDILKGGDSRVEIDGDTPYGCLSQLQGEIIDGSKSIYEVMLDEGFGNEEKIRAYLADYCLDEIDLHQKIEKLSIGEQNMLQIAVLANSNAQLLLLDEPTSHLDVYAQMAIENAIAEYKGAVLMISHDFYLIANCADYVLLVEDNTVRRIRARKFRKMVYDKYFDQKYLEIDRKRQEVENEIMKAFRENKLDTVEKLCDQLEGLK